MDMQFLLFVTWKKYFNAKVKKLLRPWDPELQNIHDRDFKRSNAMWSLTYGLSVSSSKCVAMESFVLIGLVEEPALYICGL